MGIAWALVAVSGCATVNPKPDFERVGQRLEEATGFPRVYQPGDDEEIDEIVAGLLNDGLTATEAVEIGLLHNPSLQAAFMDVGMARADVVQAGLLSNPFIGISARLPDGGGLANLEASVAQNIAELWQIPVRKRAASRSLDRTILQVALRAARLAARAKAGYYVAVAADERHRIAQENLAIAQDLLGLAVMKQEAGAASELDVNLSRSLAINAKIEVSQARLAAANARRTLAELLGLVCQADALVLTDTLPEAYPDIVDTSSLVDLARQSRLDVAAAEDAVSIAETSLEEQYLLIFPTLELGLELEREDRRSQGGRDLLADTARASIANGGLTAPDIQPRSERKSEGGQDTLLGPSLGFELPIFDQNQAQIARARYAVQQARKTLDAIERSMTQEVRGAADRALTAWRLMKTYRNESLPLAQTNLELSRESFRAGRASFLAVLEAERQFLDARHAYVNAALEAAVAVPELERTIGLPFDRLIPPDGIESQPQTTSMEELTP